MKPDENEGSFGELALLYDQPRLATIRALTDGKLWRMNRDMFSKVARYVAFEKRRSHLEFLKHCHILQNMSSKEMLDVADALKCEEYQRGHTIIHEGDRADASNVHRGLNIRCSMLTLSIFSVFRSIGQCRNSNSSIIGCVRLSRRSNLSNR